MQDTIDLLKIKIEKAKRELPLETVNAINAVDWRAAILELRTKRGYTFEQLGDLELETELLLCGLVSPENYPRELENRMKISRAQANELVNEMNDLAFKKIREELVKNTERKKIFQNKMTTSLRSESKRSPLAGEKGNTSLDKGRLEGFGKNDTQILNTAGIEILDKDAPIEIPSTTISQNREEILKKIEKPELIEKVREEVHPILAQKLSGSVQVPTVKTDHSLNNLTSNNTPSAALKIDPYREIPE